MLKQILGFLIAPALVLAWFAPGALAQSRSRVPNVEQVKVALAMNKGQWVQFRNYNGRQLIYFTGLATWKCGLRTIDYGIDDRSLGRNFPLPACNPQVPFNIGPNDKVYLTFPLHSVKTVSVRVTYSDGSQSEIRTYRPCYVQGDVTCGLPVE